jgi:tetratricopeptide (TPR) repeat protein
MMSQTRDHFAIIRRGLGLHEARRYAEALPHFERACELAPGCPTALYNRANTLHMLGRDEEAYPLLQGIIRSSLEQLREGCPACGPRSLQLDAYFLLSQVVRHGRGECEEAVRYAEEHLKRRRRGLPSLWPIAEVRAELESMRGALATGT